MKTISALLLAPSLLAACGSPVVPNLDSPGTTIVAFGDSITYGVGTTADRSYPAVLADRLELEVINAGVPGETSGEGLRRLPEVLGYDPWLVIIEFGGNDLLQSRPLEETEASLRGILDGLLGHGVVPMLVEIHGPLGGGMDDLFEELARSYGVPLVEEALPRILRTPRLKSDPIHPNAEGYAVLAQEVGDRVEELLKARSKAL